MTTANTSQKKKITIIPILRTVIQLLSFILLPGLYIGAFSGLQQIWQGIISGSFNIISLLPQLIEVITVIPITILLGRFFCGWMCAFGAMGDLISAVSHKLFKRRFKISEQVDKALKMVKYILLVFIVVGIWSLNTTLFTAASPWDAFGMLFTVGKLPDIAYVAANLLPALIILIAIIIASFFIDRFFCRYLCPLGAVFSVISKLRVTRILKPKDHCGNCRVCTNSCSMGIPLYKSDSNKSGECINCYKCVSACPRSNVTAAVLDSDVRPVLAGSMAAITMAGISYAGSFATSLSAADITVNQSASSADVAETSSAAQIASSSWLSSEPAAESSSSQKAAAESSAAQASSATANSSSERAVSSQAEPAQTKTGKYKDGTYQGSGTGFRRGTTTVSVTVQNGEITDVQVLSYEDDRPFFSRAYSTVVEEIISQQSTQVDAVSGATFSSRGIMAAVADALSNA
ncbi:4Fe-4S binding protein [Acetanaerobacterium elongatum]|uniref:4Fe-4S binding domain-containing protein n=1 Tax=Acetanaerobacterium elongatum TaxID=258515 RepID=A0A1H0F1R8_9FIRM|nr:4Fe-4S binding protein [Acetanaerobacterium elongatum]SDN88479.1 4Fe-4S binding domain-containing protein [Acetanaerobacterium elongatum]